MKQLTVKLDSLADVQDFVRVASQQRFSIEAISGEDRIDAKSFMGLFSLDLRKPIHITVDGSDSEVADFCQSIFPMLLRS